MSIFLLFQLPSLNESDTHPLTESSDVLNVTSLDGSLELLAAKAGRLVLCATHAAVVAVRAGTFADRVCCSKLGFHGTGVRAGLAHAGRSWEEDYLRVRALGHLLHSLEVSDLHGGCGAQDVGSLAHKLRRLDFGAGRDDLGFSCALALCGHGERILQVLAEDDVLDQHALDLRAPAGSGLFDDLADRLRNLLAALDNILKHAGTDDVAEGGLGALDESLADVGNAEGGLVWGGDVVVNDRCELQVDIVYSDSVSMECLNSV